MCAGTLNNTFKDEYIDVITIIITESWVNLCKTVTIRLSLNQNAAHVT